MLNFIKNKLQKIYSTITSKLSSLFSRSTVDEETLKELEKILIESDTGVKTTRHIINQLRADAKSGKITQGSDLKQALHEKLLTILDQVQIKNYENKNIFLLVGINGSGKTTFVGKLAYYYATQGKKVLLVAADTFRAAAQEQLAQWAEQTNTDIELGKEGQDPSAVVFTGCERFKKEKYDVLIIDTAGRLQTKTNLMHELSKIKRVIGKHLHNKEITTLLTIDSMLGQNSFEQAKLFKESTDVDGIVLTKMDGTGKGGIVFAITQELQIPIAYITFGEQLDQIKLFGKKNFVEELVNS